MLRIATVLAALALTAAALPSGAPASNETSLHALVVRNMQYMQWRACGAAAAAANG
jgi:hypothetical protein